jgi:hypothetical protein
MINACGQTLWISATWLTGHGSPSLDEQVRHERDF